MRLMTLLSGFLTTVGATFGASVSSTFASNMVDAKIDLGKPWEPFPHNWKNSVGSGHALLGTRSDWQAHMRQVADEIGFRGVRFHGILDDDMGVYRADGRPVKDHRDSFAFFNVDAVYDSLLSMGVKPIVELSFLPCQLAENEGKQCQSSFGQRLKGGGYKSCICPPADFEDWYKLVHAFAGHLVQRYGLEEVATWKFEVWNEMWGVQFPEPYMSLYNASAMALKAVSKKLRVGGPATMCLLDVQGFIDECKRRSLPFEFVTTHVYPTDGGCVAWGSANASQIGGDPDQFAHAILNRSAMAAAAGVPFLLTEYNDGHGGTHDNEHFSDRAYAAAFIWRNIPLLRDLDVFSWWTFTDIFEESGMSDQPFRATGSAEWGLLSRQRIPKPTYRAFQLLRDAGDHFVPLASITQLQASKDGMSLVQNETGPVTIFATANKSGASTMRIYTSNFLPTAVTSEKPALANVSIALNVPGNCGVATIQRIDEDHANPFGLWQSWGADVATDTHGPWDMNRSLVQKLIEASQVESEKLIVISGKVPSHCILNFSLPPNAVARIDLSLDLVV